MTEFWPWWVDFGAALVALLVLVVTGYAPATDARNHKFRLAAFMLGTIAITSGQFALGQTWWNRSDGQHVQWGPWASFILTLPAAAGIMCASLTRHKKVILWAMIFAAACAATTYGAARTPLRIGGNARDSAIVLVCWAYASILALGVYLLMVVMGWTKRWSAEAAIQHGSGQVGYVDAVDTSVQSRVTRVIAVLLFCAVVAVYPSLWAAGPVGFRGYTDQFTQTCLLAFMANGLLVLFTAGVYWLINPDGSSAVHMGRMGETPESRESLLPGAGAAASAEKALDTAAQTPALSSSRISSQMGYAAPNRSSALSPPRAGSTVPAVRANF